MKHQRLLVALASVFTGIAVLLVMLGIVYNLVIVVFAIPFGLAAYFLWYHVTGRLGRRATWREVDPSSNPTGDRSSRERDDRSRWSGPIDQPMQNLSTREAYRRLDLEPDASQEEVRRAYRRKVKDVHPDREAGSEQAFKEVRTAYERLSNRR